MNKKYFPLILLFVSGWSWSCQPGAKDKEPATQTGKELIEQLEAQAVDESDIQGRVQITVEVLREEYAKSDAAMEGLKKVEVEIDANCVLTISNKAYGNEITRVNLKDLDPDGFGLIPDLNEGDFPGLRIMTKGGSQAVEILKDGTVINKKAELVIYLANRPAIERITPYMLQALNICQGVQYPD